MENIMNSVFKGIRERNLSLTKEERVKKYNRLKKTVDVIEGVAMVVAGLILFIGVYCSIIIMG